MLLIDIKILPEKIMDFEHPTKLGNEITEIAPNWVTELRQIR